MFNTGVDVKISEGGLAEFFGENSKVILEELGQRLKVIYPQTSVSFGEITEINDLTGIYMTDEYGDVSVDIDKILINIVKSGRFGAIEDFPLSFCEYSSGEI